ncbi:MAG: flavin reductase, partial [Ruminococcus sp.]|nr:flavin reductase [Ruminococcus sp.]
FSFIRPQRYTFGFMQENGCFSMSFFDEEYRKALAFCGSKSGRDVDKVKETGLTPAFTDDGVPYFEEAKLVLICKKLYAQDLNEQSITVPSVKNNYNGDDYHKMYVSEIIKVLKK